MHGINIGSPVGFSHLILRSEFRVLIWDFVRREGSQVSEELGACQGLLPGGGVFLQGCEPSRVPAYFIPLSRAARPPWVGRAGETSPRGDGVDQFAPIHLGRHSQMFAAPRPLCKQKIGSGSGSASKLLHGGLGRTEW